jgi:uncharacterized membrane-anchored protein
MNKSLSFAFLAVAIVLVAFGLNAYHSAASDISRFFTGAPTDKALWLLVCGLVAGMFGIAGLVRK